MNLGVNCSLSTNNFPAVYSAFIPRQGQ